MGNLDEAEAAISVFRELMGATGGSASPLSLSMSLSGTSARPNGAHSCPKCGSANPHGGTCRKCGHGGETTDAALAESHGISVERLQELRSIFRDQDLDGDGSLSVSELCTGLGWERSKIRLLMKEFDYDQSNSLDFAEFLAMMNRARLQKLEKSHQIYDPGSVALLAQRNHLSEARVRQLGEMFIQTDQDQNGTLDVTELATVLGCIPQKAQVLLDEFDLDNSGAIDFEEFVSMMSRARKNQEKLMTESTTPDLRRTVSQAYGVSESRVAELAALFKKLDENGDNSLSVTELRDGLHVPDEQLRGWMAYLGIQNMEAAEISFSDFLQVYDKDVGDKAVDLEGLARSHQLSPERVAQLDVLFRRFDRDCDGSITVKELQQALNRPYATARALAREFDQNQNSTIEFAEFVAMHARANSLAQSQSAGATHSNEQQSMAAKFGVAEKDIQDLVRQFQAMDNEKQGSLSRMQMARGLRWSPTKVASAIENFDANRNGKIELEEFVEMMVRGTVLSSNPHVTLTPSTSQNSSKRGRKRVPWFLKLTILRVENSWPSVFRFLKNASSSWPPCSARRMLTPTVR
jgi:calmodulin